MKLIGDLLYLLDFIPIPPIEGKEDEEINYGVILTRLEELGKAD
ncbi:MAG: hypothetical protein SYNGOMJ08_00804 [Candidatus Syntrophoarchaeum sp. GoM_oil]|nr:MAG: hypothetical protein SYNGOMJ08_00804 [Candidatus Syntrophoarchaeum sp. GoM_oil]